MISLLIVFFLVAIVTSFLCSLWEAVLLSITPSYAQIKVKEGGALGRRLQAFKANIDRPLAAILTLNTIGHTVGAIGVGAVGRAVTVVVESVVALRVLDWAVDPGASGIRGKVGQAVVVVVEAVVADQAGIVLRRL